MPVTHADVMRLGPHLEGALTWLEWLSPDALDLGDETETWVELREGPRLLVLTHQRDAQHRMGCALLGEDDRCRVYSARPVCCRAYPFEVARPQGAGGRLRLALHHDTLCAPETGMSALIASPEGADAEQQTNETSVVHDAAQRELEAYVAHVAAWNRRQRRRRLAGRLPETGDVFVQSLLARGSATHAAEPSSHAG